MLKYKNELGEFDVYGLGETAFLNKKMILTFLFICILFVDITLFLLNLTQYYIISLKSSKYMSVILINIFYLYLLVVVTRGNKFWKVFWGVFGPFLIAPFLCIGWFLLMFFLPENNYYYMDTPTEADSLIIEHRNWSLGETNHLYNFYQKTSVPGLVKKVNRETVHIMTRHTNADDLEVLGVDNVEWEGAKNVIFHSAYTKTSINLK